MPNPNPQYCRVGRNQILGDAVMGVLYAKVSGNWVPVPLALENPTSGDHLLDRRG